MQQQPKSKPPRLSKFRQDTAIFSVLAAVRVFIEDNPNFSDFKIPVNQHVVSFDEKKLKGADNDYIQRLTLMAMQVETLSYERVQQLATKKVLSTYKQIKKLVFEISKNHVNVILFNSED